MLLELQNLHVYYGQIHAVKGALAKVEEKILKKHFQTCITEVVRGASEKEKKQKLDEILKLIHRTRRR